MNAFNPVSGIDLDLPATRAPAPVDLSRFVDDAYDLAGLLDGLDVLHETAHVTSGGAVPTDPTEIELRAVNALGPTIKMAIRLANDLAEALVREQISIRKP